MKTNTLLLLSELFGPVCENRNRGGAGPFEGNVDQKMLAVRRYIVKILALGNRPRLEEHFRRARLNPVLAR